MSSRPVNGTAADCPERPRYGVTGAYTNTPAPGKPPGRPGAAGVCLSAAPGVMLPRPTGRTGGGG